MTAYISWHWQIHAHVAGCKLRSVWSFNIVLCEDQGSIDVELGNFQSYVPAQLHLQFDSRTECTPLEQQECGHLHRRKRKRSLMSLRAQRRFRCKRYTTGMNRKASVKRPQ